MADESIRTVADIVVRAAATWPDRVAFVEGTTRTTWHNHASDIAALASYLHGSGLRPGDRVAVLCLKSRSSYVAAHAIQAAGGIFVPVDPLSPPQAQQQVLANCEPSVIIASSLPARRLLKADLLDPNLTMVIVGELPAGWDETLSVNQSIAASIVSWDTAIATEVVDLPSVGIDDPAYLIHTSGSTGQPKGILHSHRSAMAYATRAVTARALTADDCVAGMAPFHFDTSTFELYAAPLAGASVSVISEAHMRMPASFAQLAAETNTTIWYGVPSFYTPLVNSGALEVNDFSALRTVQFAGEPYAPAALADFMTRLPNTTFENIYGPAEVNECTAYVMPGPPDAGDDIPIGLPWEGVRAELFDEDASPSAPGDPGELWISGPTMMLGYWNAPELTASKLATTPDGTVWYRSGDICFFDDARQLVFAGRVDNQIKVRGIRIELEAVELVLSDAPGVLLAVVGPADEEVSSLVASITLSGNVEVTDVELRRFCASRLTAAAVLTRFDIVSEFPLTQSGKIDRRTVRSEQLGVANA